MHTRNPTFVERLAGCPAALLHEAVPESRVLTPEIRPVWAGAALRGLAYTVRLPAGDNGWLHRAIYESAPGAVIVATAEAMEHGYWGELMARAALGRGLAGLVIHGGVRDVDALRNLRFPVFASAICPRGTSKDLTRPGAVAEPILVEEVSVSTGDLVLGDADGVVVVPAGRLEAVEACVVHRREEERRLRERLAAGDRLVDLVSPLSKIAGRATSPGPEASG